jgi:hypothetical protein
MFEDIPNTRLCDDSLTKMDFRLCDRAGYAIWRTSTYLSIE